MKTLLQATILLTVIALFGPNNMASADSKIHQSGPDKLYYLNTHSSQNQGKHLIHFNQGPGKQVTNNHHNGWWNNSSNKRLDNKSNRQITHNHSNGRIN
jgi:hypothetical protein